MHKATTHTLGLQYKVEEGYCPQKDAFLWRDYVSVWHSLKLLAYSLPPEVQRL